MADEKKKKGLLDFLYKEVETEDGSAEIAKIEASTHLPQAKPAPKSAMASLDLISEIEADLWSKLKSIDDPNFSILQFLDIVSAQGKLTSNKEEQYKSAWETAKVAVKLTLDKIEKSYNFYLKQLDVFKDSFTDSSVEMNKTIEENKKTFKTWDNNQAHFEKEIQMATEAILSIKEERAKLMQEQETLESNLKSTSFSFEKAYEKVAETLNSEFENIQKYSGEVVDKKVKGKK